MRRIVSFASLVALFFAASPVLGQAPEMPKPTKEHEWLKQLVGEWTSNAKLVVDPNSEPMECEGTETVRSIGGFWVQAEMNSKPFGQPMTGLMTIGYDPEKKKYTGTWVDSATSHLWKYEGTLDETGKILTLEADGPNFTKPGETAKYRDIITIKDKDHKTLTGMVQTEDGEWVTFMTTEFARKK